MNIKSVLIGAALVIVGALVGGFIASHHPMKQCDKQEMVGPKCPMAGPEHGEEMRGCGPKVCAKIFEELNLSAEQKTQLDKIFEQKHMQHQEIEKKVQLDIKAILTPEQLKKYEEMEKDRCTKMGMAPDGPKPCCKKEGEKECPKKMD
jgi:periplasmic protein CpxP/Spy